MDTSPLLYMFLFAVTSVGTIFYTTVAIHECYQRCFGQMLMSLSLAAASAMFALMTCFAALHLLLKIWYPSLT